jgi:ribonucleoside-diphosphate reductase alpha chain
MTNSSISWLNKDSRTFLERGYLQPGQTPEQRIRQIAEAAENILSIAGFADKLETYIHKGWFSLSSPVWSNFGAGRGLPISCNGSFIDDDTAAIARTHAEIIMMTKHGAGTSAYFGAVRPRGSPIKNNGKTGGPVSFMPMFDTLITSISQGGVRRGSMAVYLPVDHPDIEEFLGLREEGHPIQQLSLGVCIKDAWMQAMVDGDKDKRKIWSKIIKKRVQSGYPYLFFHDAANRGAPQVYKDKGMTIWSSNLCAEISLSSSATESFVCNLSSMNLFHWNAWKDTDAVETMTFFLDAVMSDYIEKTRNIPFMEAANTFAVNQRALGVGVLGWHSYLQSQLIPFESMEAKLLNTQIFRLIRDKTHAASRELATRYGEPPLLKGYGMRNVTTMAVAPTTSSSFILGQVSMGIEPIKDNHHVKSLAKGEFSYKNPELEKLLESKGKNTREVWHSILIKGGSVQHLEFLSDHERDVFKTFGEISQKEIVIQAAARQKYIDQGQSLNLLIPPDVAPKQVSDLHIEAWRMGLKSVYYLRGANPSQLLARSLLECKSCEA